MSKVKCQREGRVLWITINRPEVMNALDSETHALLAAAIDQLTSDEELWLGVLRGAGGRAFCAGADIAAMAAAADGGDPYRVPESGYGGLTNRFDLHKPVIAAVEGVAMGGGFELALACDLVIATTGSRFALPEPRIGAVAYAGGIHRLPRQIGMKRAMDLLLTGRTIDAVTAERWGLINQVVAEGELQAVLEQTIALLLANAPLALQATKAAVHAGLAMPLPEAIALQDEAGYAEIERMRASEDVLEGIRAFTEKRPPRWQAR